jgi:hypothetical protein
MSNAANVTSLDALRQFERELKRYENSVRSILESLSGQAQRAQTWIEHDRTRYWPRETMKAEDRIAEARADLQRAKMAAIEGQHKSCLDEKKAVERAVNRLRLCEEKVRVTKHWRNQMRYKSEEFSGKMARLQNYLDNDLPRAQAAIGRKIAALEKYSETNQSPAVRERHEIQDQQEPTE